MLDSFKEGVSCETEEAKNWGSPSDEGYQWQQLTKICPAFATEYAAVLIRFSGGEEGEFHPLREKEVQISKECDDLLIQVQQFVENQPTVCNFL